MPRSEARKATKKRDPQEKLRELLLGHRQEILNLYERDLRAGQEAGDESADDIVDRANSAYSREFLFSLTGGERDQLQDIEAALAKMERGSFGVCETCGTEIGAARLQALPWARYCIDCQEKLEQGLGPED
ncbi:MAG: TraR/DksA family transcriptional regulator [Thermoanaerobaculia bacterium]